MEFLQIGWNGPLVSRICFGCAGIGGYDYGEVDDATSIKAIHRAVDLGVNFFDVADVYGFGRAENVLKSALGKNLRDLNIATKFGVGWDSEFKTYKDISKSHLRKSLEGSLSRLGCDTIPIYQLHWPDGKTPLSDAIDFMEEVRKEGKIQSLGVCNLNVDELVTCQNTANISTIQLPFSLAERQNEECMKRATAHKTNTLVYNAIAHGLFSGKIDRSSKFAGTDMRTRIKLFKGEEFDRVMNIADRIRVISEKIGKSCVQVAINYLLSLNHVGVVIVGTKKPEQIEDSVGAVGWRLDAEHITFLENKDLN